LIEVELPSGVKLRLTGDVDEAALRRVLSALS
jgi:transposase